MVENKSSLFGIIAIIIGASGLVLGAFSVVNFQILEGPEGSQGLPGEDGTDGINGDDGIDGVNGTDGTNGIDGLNGTDGIDAPFYCCSTQSEIEGALDTIGTGNGIIYITENITLSSTITIDNGGHYIIQGVGLITLDRNDDDETLNISNVKSCTIKDIIIDTSDITATYKQGIYIEEGNGNPVYIQKVQIHGGNGRGIFINSGGVWIENCVIHNVRVGIYLASDSGSCRILGNSLSGINPGTGSGYGIYADDSDFNIISSNTVSGISISTGDVSGIYAYYSDHNTISVNTVGGVIGSSSISNGIYVYYSYSNSISDNIVRGVSGSGFTSGIMVDSESISNSISGNTVNGVSGGSGFACGILFGLEFGTDSNTFTDNAIYNVLGSNRYGILGNGGNNIIMGNTVINSGFIDITGGTNFVGGNTVV